MNTGLVGDPHLHLLHQNLPPKVMRLGPEKPALAGPLIVIKNHTESRAVQTSKMENVDNRATF